MKHQPYTRREYIDGIPGSKVVKFTMGSPGKEFNTTLRLISLKAGQIRHNALEAARIAANRYLARAQSHSLADLGDQLRPRCWLRRSRNGENHGGFNRAR